MNLYLFNRCVGVAPLCLLIIFFVAIFTGFNTVYSGTIGEGPSLNEASSVIVNSIKNNNKIVYNGEFISGVTPQNINQLDEESVIDCLNKLIKKNKNPKMKIGSEYIETKTERFNRENEREFYGNNNSRNSNGNYTKQKLISINEVNEKQDAALLRECYYRQDSDSYYCCGEQAIIKTTGGIFFGNISEDFSHGTIPYYQVCDGLDTVYFVAPEHNEKFEALQILAVFDDTKYSSMYSLTMNVYCFSDITIVNLTDLMILPLTYVTVFMSLPNFAFRSVSYELQVDVNKDDLRYIVYGSHIHMYYVQSSIFPDSMSLSNLGRAIEIVNAPSQLSITTDVSLILNNGCFFVLELYYLSNLEVLLISKQGYLSLLNVTGCNGSIYFEPYKGVIELNYITEFSKIHIIGDISFNSLTNLSSSHHNIKRYLHQIACEEDRREDLYDGDSSNYDYKVSGDVITESYDPIVDPWEYHLQKFEEFQQKLNDFQEKPGNSDSDDSSFSEIKYEDALETDFYREILASTLERTKLWHKQHSNTYDNHENTLIFRNFSPNFIFYAYSRTTSIFVVFDVEGDLTIPALHTSDVTIVPTIDYDVSDQLIAVLVVKANQMIITDYYTIRSKIFFSSEKRNLTITNFNLLYKGDSVIFDFSRNKTKELIDNVATIDILTLNTLYSENNIYLVIDLVIIAMAINGKAERDQRSLRINISESCRSVVVPIIAAIKYIGGSSSVCVVRDNPIASYDDYDVLIISSVDFRLYISTLDMDSKFAITPGFRFQILQISLSPNSRLIYYEIDDFSRPIIDTISYNPSTEVYTTKVLNTKTAYILAVSLLGVQIRHRSAQTGITNIWVNKDSNMNAVSFSTNFELVAIVFNKSGISLVLTELISVLYTYAKPLNQIIFDFKVYPSVALYNKLVLKGLRRIGSIGVCTIACSGELLRISRNCFYFEARNIYTMDTDTQYYDDKRHLDNMIYIPNSLIIPDLSDEHDPISTGDYFSKIIWTASNDIKDIGKTVIFAPIYFIKPEEFLSTDSKFLRSNTSGMCSDIKKTICIDAPSDVVNITNLYGRGFARSVSFGAGSDIEQQCCSGPCYGYSTCLPENGTDVKILDPTMEPTPGYSCKGLIPGRSGGSLVAKAQKILLSGRILDFGGDSGQCSHKQLICSGSGSGGIVELFAQGFNILKDDVVFRILVSGGSCLKNTGYNYAGSSGGGGSIRITHELQSNSSGFRPDEDVKYFTMKNFYYAGGICGNISAGSGFIMVEPSEKCHWYQKLVKSGMGCKISATGIITFVFVSILCSALLILIVYTILYFAKYKKLGRPYILCATHAKKKRKAVKLNNPYILYHQNPLMPINTSEFSVESRAAFMAAYSIPKHMNDEPITMDDSETSATTTDSMGSVF